MTLMRILCGYFNYPGNKISLDIFTGKNNLDHFAISWKSADFVER